MVEVTQVSIDGWVDKHMCYTHAVEYYPAFKRKGILK